jgi:hypothetical protein
MDTPGEPVLQNAFEVREGIEMVPGTVHLVDSEFSILGESVSRADTPCYGLFSAQC